MAGVYISYPFCAQKCSYCNFASGVFPKSAELVYQNRLRDELASQHWPWVPETLYLGGGTPSLWPLDELAALLALIPGHPWTEATMEAAPGSLTPAKVAAWVDMGINRVSLGVQSMVEAEIRKTGRKHNATVVREDVALLRQFGIEAINVDLIAGLALQTESSWEESLDAVIALDVPHVSVYIFEVDEDSRLGAEVLLNGKRYGAPELPSDDLQAQMYQRAVQRLAGAGIERYEISNFARPGCESRHNLKYWRLEPYLGFGPDAHSFDGQRRWQNTDLVANYTKLAPEAADSEREKYWVGLRLSAGVEIEAQWRPVAEKLAAQGLLEWRSGRARLTDRGVLLSNEVFQEFIRE